MNEKHTTNEYIDYYDKYKISPVRQDLSDFDRHVYIRSMLYQALGIPPVFFEGKNVLEVGPGGGYNAIVTSTFKPKYYQLIDANETGAKEIVELFAKHNIDMSNVHLKNCFIEEFQTDKKFNIAICENMLCCLKNNYEILSKIDLLLEKNGVLSISCSDEVSIFYDMTRRLLANILVQREKATDFNDKLDLFEEAFSSHLATLDGFYKILRDWCADNLMGKSLYNSSLAVGDVLDFFGDRYHYYQMTPSLIVDEQWHKEIGTTPREYNNRKKSLYESAWHNIFHYKVTSEIRDSSKNISLRKYCREYFNLIEESEENYTQISKNNILNVLNNIKSNMDGIDEQITLSLQEIIDFLTKDEVSVDSIKNNFNYFKSAFGKGQQFLSLIKVDS